jgi:predicted nuclease of predicted toxin-antitoxin system
MKLLVDMNLSPQWVEALQTAGHDAVHWSQIGDPRASDPEIIAWARDHQSIVLTHDLDFTTVLALTRAEGPSVVQIRSQNIAPAAAGPAMVRVLNEYEQLLVRGAVVSVDEMRSRVRILPLR